MCERDLIGKTVVKGVALSLCRNEGDSVTLSWSSADINGSAEFGGDDAEREVWTQAIASLREDPARDPCENIDLDRRDAPVMA